MVCRLSGRQLGSSRFGAWISLAAAIFLHLGISAEARDIEELTTPSGITVWLAEDKGIPLVALGFATRGGGMLDPQDQDGVGHLLAQMLTEGAGDRDAEAFKKALGDLGAQFNFSVSQKAFTGGLVTLKKSLKEAASLLKDALHDPHMDGEDFERVKREEIAALEFQQRKPQHVAVRRFYEHAFDGHPLSRSAEGTPGSLAKISISDVRAHRARLIGKARLHVVVVGDISQDEAVSLVDNVFAAMPKGDRSVAPPRAEPADFVTREAPRQQQPVETAVFAVPLPALDHPDFFAGMVVNHILGSGNFDARLTRVLRVERGLTYAVSSQVIADPFTSFSLGLLSTKPGKMKEALEALRGVYREFAENGPTDQELRNAKSSLHGAYLLSVDTSARLANRLLGLWLDNLPKNYTEVRKAGLEDVDIEAAKRVARRYLQPERLRIFILASDKSTAP